MVKRGTTHFAGYDCAKLENDAVALWVTQSVGPRIIGLARQGGANLSNVSFQPNEAVVQELIDELGLRGGGTRP